VLTDGSIEQPEVTDDDKVRALPRTTFRAECHIWASLRGLSHDHLKHPECKLFCKKKVLHSLLARNVSAASQTSCRMGASGNTP